MHEICKHKSQSKNRIYLYNKINQHISAKRQRTSIPCDTILCCVCCTIGGLALSVVCKLDIVTKPINLMAEKTHSHTFYVDL